jgi:Transposase IS116/IS110/IS902 family
MVLERTSVGLDVHARSIVAGVLDTVTGEKCGHCGCRRPPRRSWGGSGRFSARSRLPMRRDRPGSGWPERWSRPGCGVWWWLRPSWSAHPGIGSRPTGATPSGWPGCCISGSCRECGCRPRPRRRRGTWSGPGRMPADLMRARHRLSKLLLRQGLVFEGAAWTQAHGRWLASVGAELTQPGLRVAVDEAHGAVLAVQARRDRLDAAIGELAATPTWAPLVGRLGCLRGIGVLTGFGLAVEIGDWQRFTGATLGAWLGLVPSEQSSGGRRSQGAITKDRQQPCPPAAGRGGLASPQALSAEPGAAGPSRPTTRRYQG